MFSTLRLVAFTALASSLANAATRNLIDNQTFVPPRQSNARVSSVKAVTDQKGIEKAVQGIASNQRVASAGRTASVPEPAVPEGYELTWGPLNFAANAPGYMGFTFLATYDVEACARECNKRGEDRVGGRCQFFNIWRAVVNGVQTTNTCAFYNVVSDASTAVNGGQGSLKVTQSRAYTRKNYVIDGGFEALAAEGGDEVQFVESTSNWVGTSPGIQDVLIWVNGPWAHSGKGLATFGSGAGADDFAGTLTPAQPLATTAGQKYTIQYWHDSSFNGPLEADAFLEVSWNDVVVQTITPGNSPWTRFEVTVTAVGNDKLSFRGGKFPAYSFLDDVSVLVGSAN